MSEQKHTPGPWKYVKSIGVYAGDKWEIVSFGSCSTEEGHANAQLIAAAPELLAVCELIKKWMLGGKPGPLSDSIVLEVIEATIKKARGE